MTTEPASVPARLAVHGPGRAATVLARWFEMRGARVVALSGGSEDGARQAQAEFEATPPWTAQFANPAADLVILGVPDGALGPTAQKLSQTLPTGVDSLFVHLAGSLGVAVLDPLRERGCGVGAFHPLASFPSRTPRGDGMSGSLVAIGGSDEGVTNRLRIWAESLGASALVLGEAERSAYHLGASLAHNAAVALLAFAEDLLIRSGAPEGAARAGLIQLLVGGVDAAREIGPRAALTGPVARGDVETLERHRQALASHAPDRLRLWQELIALQASLVFDQEPPERQVALLRWLENLES